MRVTPSLPSTELLAYSMQYGFQTALASCSSWLCCATLLRIVHVATAVVHAARKQGLNEQSAGPSPSTSDSRSPPSRPAA